MTVERIVQVLRSFRFHYTSEKELQKAVAKAFRQEKVPFEREKDLGEHGIVDFMIGSIALEVKIKGSPTEVAEQLIRYCECEEVTELILLTGRTRLGKLPKKLRGKAVHVVTLWETML